MKNVTTAIALPMLLVLFGCQGGRSETVGPEATELTAARACEDPYPCGGEWPPGLNGPFELKEVIYKRLPMQDGVEIELWVGLPDLPPGVRAPVVVNYTPYVNFCTASLQALLGALSPYCTGGPNDDAYWTDPPTAGPTVSVGGIDGATNEFGIPPIRLVQQGYAVAIVAQRGTANSGGCFSGGKADRQDATEVVNWLEQEPWSNGRIGLIGISASSYLALMTAAEAPRGLKALVLSGVLTSHYWLMVTPQGAAVTAAPALYTDWEQTSGVYPPVWTKEPPEFIDPVLYQRWLQIIDERACDEFVQRTINPLAMQFSDDRKMGGYWSDRNLVPRLDNVSAAVLNLHGLLDAPPSGHAYQDNELWSQLGRAPKRRIAGAWGHQWPSESSGLPGILNPGWRHKDYESILFAWYDFWLKGLGEPPEHLGRADYQDTQTGQWHQSGAWPPDDGRNEVLWLNGDGLAPIQGGGEHVALMVPSPVNDEYRAQYYADRNGLFDALCGSEIASLPRIGGTAWISAPLDQDVIIAGNPFAYFSLLSDMPGGTFSVELIELAPEFSCTAGVAPGGIRNVASGGVDLRFHAGNMTGVAFPVEKGTPVRVDFNEIAQTVPAGSRLALAAVAERHTGNFPYPATITFLAGERPDASQLVLPLASGSLGGRPPAIAYPPMPVPPE